MSLPPRKSRLKSIFRWGRRVFTLLFLAVTGFAVYLHTSGLPAWLLDGLESVLRTEVFAFDAAAGRLDWERGIVLRDARIYRLRRVGPPAAEAKEVAILIDWPALLRGENSVRSVWASDGTLRPEMTSPRDPDTGEQLPGGQSAPTMDMSLELERCSLDGVFLDRATCRLLGRDNELRFEGVEMDVHTPQGNGRISGNIVYNTQNRGVNIQGESQLSPVAILPVVRQYKMGFLDDLIQRFEFGALPPRARFSVVVRRGAENPVTVKCSFWMRDGSYQGVDFLRADGDVEVVTREASSRTTLDSLFIVRPEGNATGGFTVDTASEQVEFQVRSSFHPQAAADMISILTNQFDRFSFDGTVEAYGTGVVDYAGGSNTEFRLDVDLTDVSCSNLTVQSAHANVTMDGATLIVSNLVGKAYDGDLSGWAVISGVGADTPIGEFRLGMELDKCSFEKLVESFTGVEDQDYKGELKVNLDVRGPFGHGTIADLKGNGNIRIYDGRVFMLPVFGGLSQYMTKLIPGLDFVLRQTDASVAFDIEEGAISSEDVQIRGDVISLSGNGEYRFDNSVDFNVQIRLLKQQTLAGRILKPIFYPISKLFEFRLRGTVSDPTWYLTNFSADLLENLGLKPEEKSVSQGVE